MIILLYKNLNNTFLICSFFLYSSLLQHIHSVGHLIRITRGSFTYLVIPIQSCATVHHLIMNYYYIGVACYVRAIRTDNIMPLNKCLHISFHHDVLL